MSKQRKGPRCRVAVIGAGLAGLVVAWRLARAGHDVVLFERHARPGFVAHSVAVPGLADAPEVRVDVPIRVFYAGYYPTLVRLYAELGVATQAVSYASSFHGDVAGREGALYFRYRNLLLAERSYSWVAPQDVAAPRAWRIVAGALRFRREAPRALHRGELAGLSIGEFVRRGGYGEAFVRGLLLPAITTVCTCSYADAERFPAAVIVEYLMRGLTREPVRRAVQGADDVAARLLAGIGEVRLGQALAGLARCEGDGSDGSDGSNRSNGSNGSDRFGGSDVGNERGGVLLRLADGHTMRVDHAVLATQANQALALLAAGASAAERQVLAGFTYRPIEVVMHTDARLLPARQRDWSAVNLLVTPGQAQPQSTIWVNAVQPALAASARVAPIFQTVHPLLAPRDETVLAWSRFERPLVDAGSERALAGLAALHAEPGRRIWFCGSYAQPGIPLLESAVRSAEKVVSLLAAATSGQAAAADPALPGRWRRPLEGEAPKALRGWS